MFFRILKKELKRKKGINLILFLFILLATIFVASSVNNILVVSGATNYCMDTGNVPDRYIYTYEQEGQKTISDWLDHEGKNTYTNYEKNEAILASLSNIKKFGKNDGSDYTVASTILIQPQWKTYMKIFDKNQELLKVKDGEIGMQQSEMNRNGLKPGDKITFSFGDYQKEFTILPAILDPVFGGDYVGMTRYVVSEDDYNAMIDAGARVSESYCVDTDDVDNFDRQLNKQGFTIAISLDRDAFKSTYVISMISAGVLIVVGVCLIIIAFLILRFTILVTIQEEFKEIGIMKAIGLNNGGIRKIYLVKYLALSFFAVILGCFASVPVSSMMIQTVASNIMMQSGSAHFQLNMICSAIVLVVVLGFCYFSTGKLNKISAVEAIRSGQSGERYKKHSALSLYRKRTMKVPFFMAVNDIFSNIKRYVVLILTFAIGTILIILPLNTITSLGSKEMAKNFTLDLDSDFYISANGLDGDGNVIRTRDTVKNSIDAIQQDLYDAGYDTDIHSLLFYSFGFYTKNEDDISQYMVVQPFGGDGSDMEMLQGSVPLLDNEVALSEKIAQKMDLTIGDTVHMKVNDKVCDMIVSGIYQNFIQMGQSAIVSETFDTDGILTSGSWYLQCKVKNIDNKDDLISTLQKKFPAYKIFDYKGAMNQQLGSTGTQLSSIKKAIVVLICGINMLITILMMKIFIMGETGQIAMLRSIGFSLSAVRCWQVTRMGLVLILGVVLGSISSAMLNGIVLRPIFGMMGATHMKIQVSVLEAYVEYPLLLLAVILLAAFYSAGSIRKMNLMEINNVE